MAFAVFDCNQTARLSKEALDAGFLVWVPECLQKVRLRGATKDTLEPRIPEECRGYILVEFDQRSLFRIWAKPKYYVNLHVVYNGPPGLEGPERAYYFEPYRLADTEVAAYAKQLEKESAKVLARAAGPRPRRPGEKVSVVDGLLEGTTGVVIKSGKKQILVQIGIRKVWLPGEYLG